MTRPTPPPQTLTELLSKVDWREMDTDVFFRVRHKDTGVCPIVAALGGEERELNSDAIEAAVQHGYDKTSVQALADAADWNPAWGFAPPAIARWRHWQLEQIHASQTVTEQQ